MIMPILPKLTPATRVHGGRWQGPGAPRPALPPASALEPLGTARGLLDSKVRDTQPVMGSPAGTAVCSGEHTSRIRAHCRYLRGTLAVVPVPPVKSGYPGFRSPSLLL